MIIIKNENHELLICYFYLTVLIVFNIIIKKIYVNIYIYIKKK